MGSAAHQLFPPLLCHSPARDQQSRAARGGETRQTSSTPCAPVNPTLPSTSTPSPRFHAPSRPESALHAHDCPINRLLNRLPPESFPWLVSTLFSEYIPITDSASSCSSPFPQFPHRFYHHACSHALLPSSTCFVAGFSQGRVALRVNSALLVRTVNIGFPCSL